MPRTPRAQRQPGPGTNRTDLATPTPAPIQTAPGQTYGEAAQQQNAQRAIPTANGPTMQPGGAPQMNANDIMAQAIAHGGPGQRVQLDQPTARPNEPVTHGVPLGAGSGPEALSGVGAAARDNAIQQGTLANLLSNLSSQPTATAAVRQLATVAQTGAQ